MVMMARLVKLKTSQPRHNQPDEQGGAAPAHAALRKDSPTRSRKQALQERREHQLNRVSNQTSAAAKKRRKTQRDQHSRDVAHGNPRALGPRDQGPVRAYVRSYVDSRRSPGELLLMGSLLVLGIGLAPVSPATRSLSMLAITMVIALTIVDCFVVARRLRKELPRRFPHDCTRGAVLYAIMRSTQMRRMRFPPASGDAPSWFAGKNAASPTKSTTKKEAKKPSGTQTSTELPATRLRRKRRNLVEPGVTTKSR